MIRLFILWSFLSSSSLGAQPSLFDHLAGTQDTIHLTLETNWKQLNRNKKKKEYQPLQLQLSSPGLSLPLSGKIRTRGNIRLEVCDNPSLKIKLDKQPLMEAGFSDVNELKLVQQCSNSSLGENYLRREYLAYALHQLYSEHHHRTIPVVLHVSGEDDIQAFIVEEEEQLTARYGRLLEPEKASTRGVNRKAYVNLCLFNYLILNTDWQIFNLHNVELLADTVSRQTIPIPYDFDYSGFVATSYSVPRKELNISSVHVPKWLGRHVTEEEIKVGAAHFLARKEAAEKLIQEFPGLREGDRKRLLKILDQFNDTMASEKKLMRLIR